MREASENSIKHEMASAFLKLTCIMGTAQKFVTLIHRQN